jgi:hypothetical protein
MNSTYWLTYFQRNRLGRAEPEWESPLSRPSSLAAKIAASLSHFQLGESGEGSCLFAKARDAYPDDTNYHAALDLFIKEEQEHARLLSRLVGRLGGRLIARHWTHTLFRLLRRALGATFEIQVLVIAEVVGTSYYRLLGRHFADPVVRHVCELLLRDEAKHIEFHRDRFATDQRRWLPWKRTAWAAQFQMLFLGATAVAWADHGSALRAIGGTRREFVREARDECIRLLDALTVSTLIRTHQAPTRPDASNHLEESPRSVTSIC